MPSHTKLGTSNELSSLMSASKARLDAELSGSVLHHCVDPVVLAVVSKQMNGEG